MDKNGPILSSFPFLHFVTWLFLSDQYCLPLFQMQTLYSHHKKVRPLTFINDIITCLENTINGSHISIGEMHDIFVGLMGRRNSEPGECGNFAKVLSSYGRLDVCIPVL